MSSGAQPTPTQQSTLNFDGYTLDLMIGTLRRGEEEIKLRPKSYEALKAGIAKPPEWRRHGRA